MITIEEKHTNTFIMTFNKESLEHIVDKHILYVVNEKSVLEKKQLYKELCQKEGKPINKLKFFSERFSKTEQWSLIMREYCKSKGYPEFAYDIWLEEFADRKIMFQTVYQLMYKRINLYLTKELDIYDSKSIMLTK